MPKQAVIDSGPLIALFDKDDSFHETCKSFVEGYCGILITSVAVLTEVCHMLDFRTEAQLDFLNWISRGGLSLEEITADDLPRICALTEKYSDLPMDFADASLIVLAERMKLDAVVSIDSDFYVYRTLGRKHLTNLLLP